MDPDSIKALSDNKLIGLLKLGNDQALEEIFNRYWERMHITAVKVLHDEELAKDIVQEIFINLWERRLKLHISNLNSYLNQAVKFKVISHFRKGHFREIHDTVLKSITSDQGSEKMLEFNELNEAILESLKHLPNRCREIFVLSRYEQLSNKEIAKKLNLSIRTVETQISTAIKHLRKEFRD